MLEVEPGRTVGRVRRGVGGLAERANPAFAAGAVAIPLLALTTVVAVNRVRALAYVHVMAGVLWTGIDVFMGGVLGPVVGGLDPERRAAFFGRFTPKMTFLMPTLATVTIAGGITLAIRRGFLADPDPWLALLTAATAIPLVLLVGYQYDALTDRRTLAVLAVAVVGSGAYLASAWGDVVLGDAAVPSVSPWILAALAIVTLLSLIGFGVILPGEIRIYRQVVSEDPDTDVIATVGMRNARMGGVQGALQLAIVFVMVSL